MKTQGDSKKRVVLLNNLIAMCATISGTCHVFEIAKVTPNRVQVVYSNPDEYGNNEPVTAHYPAYPNGFERDNPWVVLDAVRYDGCTGRNSECWQAFDALTDCPELFRMPDGAWKDAQTIRNDVTPKPQPVAA